MSEPQNELLEILNLEQIELDLYRGLTPAREGRRIYGGQVVAQALTAAYRTIEGRLCHSMHAYFIRPGDASIPILFQVDRARDGGSFSVRRVTAIQNGKQIFNLAASFQVPEEGFEHQDQAPAVAPPEDLLNEEQLREADGVPPRDRDWPVEVRPVNPQRRGRTEPLEPLYDVWFKARQSVGTDVAVNQCALAYGSDMSLLDASLRPHPVPDGELQVASLDHALWFHRPSDFSDWHLYVQDSPSASGGRGFNRGSIFDRQGRLVASATQEALIRHRPPG
ncbi:acyl-CoA thioesterase II [Phenylobacterium sp.]|uniref:acyl-CoA thioesterase n=1 Tax=Phenylobacterium sp. TaxID=1871053 RepID=UPI0027303443|nr:acyl-CoA thioesterase II [Phenylobacterium sp.]MDP1615768.1 acyl-CoA thioesterase II [Phenylobacterium sp.]MDP1988922.1 acyl-CoA thioesterase II [Phenylobacterium sp.]